MILLRFLLGDNFISILIVSDLSIRQARIMILLRFLLGDKLNMLNKLKKFVIFTSVRHTFNIFFRLKKKTHKKRTQTSKIKLGRQTTLNLSYQIIA